MALPTVGLTLHADASDTDRLFTTANTSTGVHTGTPADGGVVTVWDDEGDGISDVCLAWFSATTRPLYRSSTPLMRYPCLDFDGTDDYLRAVSQNLSVNRILSSFISASAYTTLAAFYAELIDGNPAGIYSNRALLADANARYGIFFRDAGGGPRVLAYNFDGTVDFVELPCTVGATHVVQTRHAGGNLYLSLDGGAEVSVASGDTIDMTLQLYAGCGQSAFFNGRIGELAIYNVDKGATGAHLDYFLAKWLAPAASGRGRSYHLGLRPTHSMAL